MKTKENKMSNGYGYSKVIEDIQPLLNQPVRFTKIEGNKRIHFYGTLHRLYGHTALLMLDSERHNYATYTINYVHLFLGEGYIKHLNEIEKESEEI